MELGGGRCIPAAHPVILCMCQHIILFLVVKAMV